MSRPTSEYMSRIIASVGLVTPNIVKNQFRKLNQGRKEHALGVGVHAVVKMRFLLLVLTYPFIDSPVMI